MHACTCAVKPICEFSVNDVFWSHAAVNLGDAGHEPWEQEWNWNSNEDGRAQQQGSHTAVYEIEP